MAKKKLPATAVVTATGSLGSDDRSALAVPAREGARFGVLDRDALLFAMQVAYRSI